MKGSSWSNDNSSKNLQVFTRSLGGRLAAGGEARILLMMFQAGDCGTSQASM